MSFFDGASVHSNFLDFIHPRRAPVSPGSVGMRKSPQVFATLGSQPAVLAETFDQDGGIVMIPNTGADTVLITLTSAFALTLDSLTIVAYDMAALAVTTWSLRRNGIYQHPWVNQRLTQGILYNVVNVKRGFNPGDTIDLAAQVPTTAAAGFQLTGRFKGRYYGGFKR